MRRLLFLLPLLALLIPFWIPSSAGSTAAPQTYRTGTACDDAWQEGPFPGTTSGIRPSSDYRWGFAPVGWSGQGHIYNPAFRFQNVQVAPNEVISSAIVTLGFYNDFPGVTQFDIPVQVELGNADDICFTNDIIHRTFTPAVEWHAVITGETASFDITGMVQQAVNAPGWVKGGSILVRLVGEDDRAVYPFSYGWNVLMWDCRCGLVPTLTLQTAA